MGKDKERNKTFKDNVSQSQKQSLWYTQPNEGGKDFDRHQRNKLAENLAPEVHKVWAV